MLSPAASPPRLATLVLVTALSTLSLSMFLPSLSNIARDFQADYALVNLSMAGYAATTAVVQLIVGPLSDRYGRRPVLLWSLLIFVVASIGCGLSGNIWTFLVCRMVQATVIAGWVIAAAVVRDTHPPQRAASRIGYISMAMAVAPIFGPMIGGILDEQFGWRASFVAFVVCGAAVFALCWRDLGETNLTPTQTFGAQFRSYPDLVRSRQFWGYAVCMASTTAAFYSFLGGVPLVAQAMFDMSTSALGLYMGVTTVGFFVGSYLSGRFSTDRPLYVLMLAGRGVACIGLVAGLLSFALIGVTLYGLFGGALCVGLGNGLTLPSTSAGAMSVRSDLAGSAAGLSGALTLAAGACASALTGFLITAENGAWVLLWLMLAVTCIGLVAAIYVRWLEAARLAGE